MDSMSAVYFVTSLILVD